MSGISAGLLHAAAAAVASGTSSASWASERRPSSIGTSEGRALSTRPAEALPVAAWETALTEALTVATRRSTLTEVLAISTRRATLADTLTVASWWTSLTQARTTWLPLDAVGATAWSAIGPAVRATLRTSLEVLTLTTSLPIAALTVVPLRASSAAIEHVHSRSGIVEVVVPAADAATVIAASVGRSPVSVSRRSVQVGCISDAAISVIAHSCAAGEDAAHAESCDSQQSLLEKSHVDSLVPFVQRCLHRRC